jgi:hypothetical protein
VDGTGVMGTCLAAVLDEKENTPALSPGGQCMEGAGVGGTRRVAVLTEKERVPALA